MLHCIVQEDLDTLAEATADVYRKARTSIRAYTYKRRRIARDTVIFFSFSLHRQRKKSSSRRQVCRLRSLINAVKQAQVTNWRVICIVIVTQAFAWRNREGAVPRGSFASLDLTENSGKERLRRVVPTLKRNTLL